jgi:Ca2+-binding RTX toxin-like protein
MLAMMSYGVATAAVFWSEGTETILSTLATRGNRNILIGGQGTDTVDGTLGENILLGGYTIYDSHPRALNAILKEWSSNTPYATRTARIETGTGGLNSSFYLSSATAFDENAVDTILGGSGEDWFFSRETGNRKDTVLRRKDNEKTTKL